MRVQIGEYMMQVWRDELPGHFSYLAERADLTEQFGDLRGRNDEDSSLFCVSIGPQFQMSPTLLVTQRFSPDVGGFDPGVLIMPETGLVMIGTGERLLAYDLKSSVRLWEDAADAGFWWWDRQGNTILMAAELELAAWNIHGHKLWTMFVEPPWSYSVHDGHIQLDVMDNLSRFPLHTGPEGV